MPDLNSLKKELIELEKELSTTQVKVDSEKLTLNGSFGKFGSKWSVLYSPELMIRVTITGQLALLMLIESIETSLADITVVSANTDGIVIKCANEDKPILDLLIKDWERATGFNTEETQYAALYSRDVNNYVAIKPNGDVKTKGAFQFDGLAKNPSNMICNDAVINWLVYGILPEHTVQACKDPRRFVTIRHVKGGAVTNFGEYLGKAVRWYYSEQDLMGEYTHIKYAENGNLVAGSTGSSPLMELPNELPRDIDLDWYVREAKSILADIGARL